MTPDEAEIIRTEIDALRRQSERSRSDRAWQLASRAAVALMVPVVLAAGSWLNAMSVKVDLNTTSIRIIQETRFTAEMGHALEASILTSIAKSYPPRWLQDSMARLEKGIEKLDAQVGSFDDRLHGLEARIGKE